MIDNPVYHGSNRIRGEEILRDGIMPLTRGNHHWLGDGAYFYKEEFYSYKWIVDMFKKRYTNEEFNYDNLLKRYLILKCNVYAVAERVFDLTKSEHMILFDFILKKLKDKIPNTEMPEGIVLNYMFNELGYDEGFDLVRAVFTLNRNHYTFKNRLGYMPQEQICIKNQEVVQDIEEYHFKYSVDHFDFLLHNMYYDNIQEKNATYNYNRETKYNIKQMEQNI